METYIEFFIFVIIVVILVFIFNVVMQLRTAASVALALLIAGFAVYFFENDFFTDALVSFGIVIMVVYGMTRAFRDKRDDSAAIDHVRRENENFRNPTTKSSSNGASNRT